MEKWFWIVVIGLNAVMFIWECLKKVGEFSEESDNDLRLGAMFGTEMEYLEDILEENNKIIRKMLVTYLVSGITSIAIMILAAKGLLSYFGSDITGTEIMFIYILMNIISSAGFICIYYYTEASEEESLGGLFIGTLIMGLLGLVWVGLIWLLNWAIEAFGITIQNQYVLPVIFAVIAKLASLKKK